MTGFCDLSYAVKTVFLVITFITVCGGLCLIPYAFRMKMKASVLTAFLCFAISSTMLILFAVEVKSTHPAWRTTPLIDRVTALPVILPILLLLFVIAVLSVIAVRVQRKERNSITRSSVKESLDSLNTGLCFAYKNGMVMLINHRMDSLCHTILGRDLQNANAFWTDLNSGAIQPEAARLSMGEDPSFRLHDGTVWTFARTVVDGVTQLTAAETTRLNALTEKLKEKNAELSAMNQRLRKYGENADALTREKERLETKIRIHRELGQALLMSRGYLQSESSDTKALFDTLKRTIAILRLESVSPRNDDPMEILLKAAGSAGIEIHINGRMPRQENIRRLFFEAATEALTNAVRHADAKNLYIVFSKRKDTRSVCFTNDGEKPQEKIIEGGGLGALRKETEQLGGTMKTYYKDGFALKLTVPAERRDDL